MRVFRFIDFLGCVIHTINDPEDRLPIPHIGQVITIGVSRMSVQSVLLERDSTARVYSILVREISANEQVFTN